MRAFSWPFVEEVLRQFRNPIVPQLPGYRAYSVVQDLLHHALVFKCSRSLDFGFLEAGSGDV